MYLTSQQANIMGPGTGLVQRYDLSRAQSDRMTAATRGMGCACKGLAGCPCGGSGFGLFDSGMDPSGWGLPEFGIVALGGYMILSTLFTTKRAARRVRGAVSGAYRGARKSNPGRRRKSRR